MAMVFVTLDWDPHPAIIASQFFIAADHITNYRDPLERAINEVLRPAIRENFDSEGRPPWVPLSDATLLKDSYTGGREQILVKTGVLREIATSARPWTIERDEAYLIGGKLGEAYYGALHQSGTKWMPARPWATLTPQDEQKIEEVFSEWSFNTIANVGLWGRAVGFFSRIARR